jgi:protein-tyrosine phosphatase
LKPGRRIDIPSVPNLRDLGGYPTEEGGQVRTGQLYRSVELDHLEGQDEDLESFVRLGVRTVFDLRTAAEREAAPDVVLDGTEQVVCDVLKDSQNLAPAVLGKVLSDPSFARQLLGDGKAVELFETAYREIVTLPSALSAYRAFFNAIIEDGRRPALFHCTTGKDRTGWAAAATLMVLGVPERHVFYDYELTNRDLLPALKPVFEHFRALGGDPDLLKPALGVDPEYLRVAMDEMQQRFGSIRGYFENGLGIGPEGQHALQAALIEPLEAAGLAE